MFQVVPDQEKVRNENFKEICRVVSVRLLIDSVMKINMIEWLKTKDCRAVYTLPFVKMYYFFFIALSLVIFNSNSRFFLFLSLHFLLSFLLFCHYLAGEVCFLFLSFARAKMRYTVLNLGL